MRKIAISLILGLTQYVSAGELTILGIKFDEPFSGNVCATLSVSGRSTNEVALSQVTQPCVGPRNQYDWQGAAAKVWIPPLLIPNALLNPITVIFNGDRPKAMLIDVGGVSMNAAAFDLLKEKLGQPTKVENATKQNAYGAKFEVIEAEWQTPNFEASLSTSAINKGVIFIAGPAATAKNIEIRAKQNTQRKPSL